MKKNIVSFISVFIVLLLISSGCAAQTPADSKPAAMLEAPNPQISSSNAPAASAQTDVQASTPVISPPTPEATVTPTDALETTPSASPLLPSKLIAEAVLPAPEKGKWYEWDKLGSYPSNSNNSQCGLVYIEQKGLIVYTEAEKSEDPMNEESKDPIFLKARLLDGTDERILDNAVTGPMNYFDGWIYYVKEDGVYKIRLDGKEKQKISDVYAQILMIYNGRIYTDVLESINLDGKDFKRQKIPDVPIGFSFIEKGNFYYAAKEKNVEGGDCWSIYRYNIKTGAFKELLRNAMGSLVVRDGWAYYPGSDDIERTNGKKTQIVDKQFELYYNLYRNYILFIGDGEALYACDIKTGKEYKLFSIQEALAYMNITVTKNNVFLYTGFKGDSIYRITFEDNKAMLWQLSGL